MQTNGSRDERSRFTVSLQRPSRVLLSAESKARLVRAFRDARPLTGVHSGLYKYPARFSPNFVGAAIETFTKKDDIVLDPFVGGGTTVVEALALGRRFLKPPTSGHPSEAPCYRVLHPS